ncbi:ATP-dependent 6-phosphofructokinase 4, chloroplastic [Turnera subulata]|uniref:ATP-dependent 6-phosphofructokinase 4, chloroplastic n=1 Tax=Turnera subulata TaxID=218843 RepID=A0A9Q0FTE0_9ROSI|nr:ATP-dependent 6-phosphofructokinase 4, chloroplastic [Turnera subulata]
MRYMEGRIAKELYSEALLSANAAELGHEPSLNGDLRDEDDGSLWGGSDEEFDNKPSDLDREWQKRREQFHTVGYRDGLIAGKEASAQEGFNVGFKQSVVGGYNWGLVRGVTSALACLPDDLKEKLIKTQEERNQFQGLYESVHSISTTDALKLFHDDMMTKKEATPSVDTMAGSSSKEGTGKESSDCSLVGNYVGELQSLLLQCPDIKSHLLYAVQKGGETNITQQIRSQTNPSWWRRDRLSPITAPSHLSLPFPSLNSHKFKSKPSPFPFPSAKSPSLHRRPPINALSSRQNDDGFLLEDVPHLTDFLPDLPAYPNPLEESQAYGIVKQTFVGPEDAVAEKSIIQRNSPRGVHFRRAGPTEKVYFKPEEVRACVVTCGGLCPGINTVIREIVCGLRYMYGVTEGGYKGFYSKNTIQLTPKAVNDIHKRGGTILCTSRGGHDTNKIVDNIQDREINQEVARRGLPVAVAGIPKTIDNDIAVIDKSFGFDTAVEEAQRAINAAHVEVESFIAMFATLASRDVDCCLIPESPFYLEGPGGLFEYVERRLKENGHTVLVIAEGAGQEYVAQKTPTSAERDASGNKLLLDVGLWLSNKIKDHFTKVRKLEINMKYIDPTYMIRAIPSNASDNIYCTLLAQSAVHGAMAGYTGFTVGPRITEAQNTVKMTDRMWARLLASTNQPSFLQSR